MATGAPYRSCRAPLSPSARSLRPKSLRPRSLRPKSLRPWSLRLRSPRLRSPRLGSPRPRSPRPRSVRVRSPRAALRLSRPTFGHRGQSSGRRAQSSGHHGQSSGRRARRTAAARPPARCGRGRSVPAGRRGASRRGRRRRGPAPAGPARAAPGRRALRTARTPWAETMGPLDLRGRRVRPGQAAVASARPAAAGRSAARGAGTRRPPARCRSTAGRSGRPKAAPGRNRRHWPSGRWNRTGPARWWRTARRPGPRRPGISSTNGRRWPLVSSMMSSHSCRRDREIVQLPSTVTCTIVTRRPRSCTSDSTWARSSSALTTTASLIAWLRASTVRSRWISVSTPSRRPGRSLASRSLMPGMSASASCSEVRRPSTVASYQ